MMPTTSLWPICASAKGTKGTIAQVLEYVENEKKTETVVSSINESKEERNRFLDNIEQSFE